MKTARCIWFGIMIALMWPVVCRSQDAGLGGVYRVSATTGIELVLPAAPSGSDWFVDASGKWQPLATQRRERGGCLVKLDAGLLGPDGETRILLGKPDWMVVEDRDPPEISGVRVNGQAYAKETESLQLGCIAGPTAELAFTLRDALNPIAPAACGFAFDDSRDVRVELDAETLGPPAKSGTLAVRLSGLQPGAYEATLRVCDLAPARNALVRTVGFSVFGLSVGADEQSVRLANGHSEYRLQADKLNHVLLPGGIWSRLTTNTDGAWLYPRQFTDIEVAEDTSGARTVVIKANTQDIKGEPHEGLGSVEFRLTIRRDTPALLVTSRSRNISDRSVTTYANWGWLPASHYVTSAGRKEWRGKAADQYFDVGHVGWLWLAPTSAGKTGLVWMSHLKFGESRFDSMLLYSERKTCKPGEAVEMRFAIARADSAEQAEAIYTQLVAQGLVTPPPQPQTAGD